MDTYTTTLVLFIAAVQLTRARLLIGCDPRGELWVGAVDDSESETVRRSAVTLGSLSDNREHNTTASADVRQAALRGNRYGTMSYDLFSDNILVELLNRDGSFRGLTTIPACRPAAKSPDVAKVVPDSAVLERVSIVDAGNPYLVTCAGVGHDCGWSAFTYFYSVIYFLFVGQYGTSENALTTRVELRALTGCTDILFPTDPTSAKTAEFPVLNCSRIVATVLEVPPGGDAGWTLRAGKHMAVEPIDNTLHFFFQISQTRTSSFKAGDSHGYGDNKHTDYIADEFTENDVSDWANAKENEWNRLKLFTLDKDKPKKNKGNVAYVLDSKKQNGVVRSNESDSANRSKDDGDNIFPYSAATPSNVTNNHDVTNNYDVINKNGSADGSGNNSRVDANYKHITIHDLTATHHGNSDNNTNAVTQNTNFVTSDISNAATDSANNSDNANMSTFKNIDGSHNEKKPTHHFAQNRTHSNATAEDNPNKTTSGSTNGPTDASVTTSTSNVDVTGSSISADITNTTDYRVPNHTAYNNSIVKDAGKNKTTNSERLYTVQTSLYRVTNIGRVDVLHAETDRVSGRTLPLRGYGGVSAQGK